MTLALREAIKRGWVQGPRIVDAAQSISTTGGHMDGRGALNDELVAHLPDPENLCDSVESCRRVVRRQIDRGADVIKFATTGGVNSGTGLATRMLRMRRGRWSTPPMPMAARSRSMPMAPTGSSWRCAPVRIRSSMAR